MKQLATASQHRSWRSTECRYRKWRIQNLRYRDIGKHRISESQNPRSGRYHNMRYQQHEWWQHHVTVQCTQHSTAGSTVLQAVQCKALGSVVQQRAQRARARNTTQPQTWSWRYYLNPGIPEMEKWRNGEMEKWEILESWKSLNAEMPNRRFQDVVRSWNHCGVVSTAYCMHCVPWGYSVYTVGGQSAHTVTQSSHVVFHPTMKQ